MFRLILSGRHREALDELELSGPSLFLSSTFPNPFPTDIFHRFHIKIAQCCTFTRDYFVFISPKNRLAWRRVGATSFLLSSFALTKSSLAGVTLQTPLLRDARAHFERARVLGPESIVAASFIHKVRRDALCCTDSPVDPSLSRLIFEI